jgi:PTH1 family peptidyl-tRNA hydrolase
MMWLIVGLGNPGSQYELSRHNFGFLAIDALLDQQGVSTKAGFSGQIARIDLDHACTVLKPETFMNKSGLSVQQAMTFHQIAVDNLVVVHDELDLSLGDIRIKRGGSTGGHNGLKDIARLIGPDFIRIRLGIGRPHLKGIESSYVLSPFTDQELLVVEKILPQACAAIKTLVTDGLQAAQQQSQVYAQKKD